MGNQQSDQRKQNCLGMEYFRRLNKHFSTQFMELLDDEKAKKILKDLSIEQAGQQSHKINSRQHNLIHMLQFNDDFTFQKTLTRLTPRLNTSPPHIFNLTAYKIIQQKHLCSLSRKMYISLNNYDFTLRDLITSKINMKQSFSQQEVLIVLSKIVQGVIWMHDNQFRNVLLDGEAVCFVRGKRVMGDSQCDGLDDYQCKIVDQDIVQYSAYKEFLQSLIASRTTTEQLLPQPRLSCYLSPQLLQCASNHVYYPSFISLKSDIFTLGMLMMQLCCQQEMFFCYNTTQMTLDYESLIHRIAKISYSNELKLLLAEMLEYDVGNRVGFVSLKEKLQKIMVKGFQETKRLKRRSSSTMLRELLSCSRASVTVENSTKQTHKQGMSSRISTVSRSLGKRQANEEMSSQKQQKTQIVNHSESLRKSNSLVNLKCKTNSFLTSKKTTLMRNDSHVKMETDTRRLMDREVSFESRVDYSKVLRNRVKTEPKAVQCPRSDLRLDESKASQCQNKVMQDDVNIKLQQSSFCKNISRPFDILITDRSIQDDQISHVSSHKINQLTQQSTVNKPQPTQTNQQSQKPQPITKFNHSFVKKKVINLDKINLTSSSLQKKQNNSLCINLCNKEKSTSQNKLKPKESTLSVQKVVRQKNSSIMSSKLLVKNGHKVERKDIDVSGKSWIIGKLKGKTQLQNKSKTENNTLMNTKDKSSGKKKQTSLSKIKSISLPHQQHQSPPQHQPITLNINLSTSRPSTNQNNQPTSRNDTIIKRLQLTQQKGQQQNLSYSSEINDQMKMIDKVMEKCVLSSSRWQEDENHQEKDKCKDDDRFVKLDNVVKYTDVKQRDHDNQPKASQFKKKSKVIDIDLGMRQEHFLSHKGSFLIKDQKRTSSKLQKLKQLTIFTEDQADLSKPKRSEQNEGKQNNMQNSNRQQQPNNNNKPLTKNISNSYSLTLNEIPYQRIEYVNYTSSLAPTIPQRNLYETSKTIYDQPLNNCMKESICGKQHSTLSKPFQEIQLNYLGEGQMPLVNSPELMKERECEEESNLAKGFSMNNSQELTFRLRSRIDDDHKGKSSFFKQTFQPKVQKATYFQKQDGSFVMREENPLKSIQTSSIIGQQKSNFHLERNTIQDLFKRSTSKFNTKQMQSLYQGYKKRFCTQQQEGMNSSCSSINLSEIQHTVQKGESFLFNSELGRDGHVKLSEIKYAKHKHISILEAQEQLNHPSRDLSINLKNLTNNQHNQQTQEYNTYRRYLLSNQCTSRVIQLADNCVYQGEVNANGELEGNGLISRRNHDNGTNVIVYTGSFVAGLYDGFGTLYDIQKAQEKMLRLPNKRISFGGQRNCMKSDNCSLLSYRPIKYEGEFSSGMENGFGTYFYQNGDKFSGCIKDGKIEGYGTYHFVQNGEVISGMWRNNSYTDC